MGGRAGARGARAEDEGVKTRRLAFVIHHLNPWGGHDRSTLEIIRSLSRSLPAGVRAEIHSYTLDDPGLEGRCAWGRFEFRRARPHLRKPAVLLISWFYLVTALRLGLVPRLGAWWGRGPRPLVHATGASSWISDVIQVQFVQAAWEKKLRALAQAPGEVYQLPSTRSGGPLRRALRGLYHRSLLSYNLWAERRIYRTDKTYIAIAHSVARELEENFGIPRARIHVIHHGVDAAAFRPAPEGAEDRARLRQELGLAPGELAAVFVGEYERKGLATAIRALGLLPEEQRRRTRLVAVGGGDHRGFAGLARGLGVEERVLLVGHRKDIPRFYRACDLFVLPTLYEPFGLVIIEAMASGLPIVVSRLAGAAELLEQGRSGMLLENPSDPEELARAMGQVLASASLRASLGAEARKAAEARSWQRVAGEYQAVLEKLL